MKKLLAIILIISLGIVLLAGCTEDNQNINPPNNDPNVNQPNPDKDKPDTTPIEPPVNNLNEKVTFKEAFPDTIMGNPSKFLRELLPGFRLGLTKEEVKSLLGNPKNVDNVTVEWGDREDWYFEDINGYRFIVSFDSEGTISNFKIVKDLIGDGNIPVLVNKTTPSNGDPVTYDELGFEDVLLGTKVDEVLQRYGEPVKSYISFDEMYGYNLGLVYKGITIGILLENEQPYVQLIESNELGVVDTYRGIHVGSNVDEVLLKYGEPGYNWDETGDLIYATDDYWFAIRFQIIDSKVNAINIYEAS